ncbi:MAG: 30S ribosomal protein S2 [Bacteroidetes bacterium QS_9_68_14]|nr:MAG: 30S ribosomal protein S2 [Bacteroidetes bacterium QS_9_68_14]
MANEDPQQDSPTSEASAPEEEDGSNAATAAAAPVDGDDDTAEGDAEDGANAEASVATGNASDDSADAGEADASTEEPDAEDAEEQDAEEEGADTVAADDVPETDPSEAPENGEAEDAGEAAQQQHEQEAPAHRATVEDLLKAGAHYGHLTSRWHPKMKKHIFMERSGIHILDLMQTQVLLDEAADAARRFAARGKNILFIGTKKQAQDIMRDGAERTDQPHMVERWLGGTMTNFETIRRSIRRMEEIEKMDADGTLDKLKKKEKLIRLREHEKLEDTLGGIRQLARLPGAVFVVDIRREEIAVREANKLGIPVIAMVDTNCDPSRVEYPIPANDDALSSIELVTTAIADAIEEGSRERQAKQEEG